MDQPKNNIVVREASAEDTDFVVSLLPSLCEFGVPPWRDAGTMTAIDIAVLSAELKNKNEGTIIFIAEDEEKNRLGFIYLQPGTDYYQKNPHGHISDIVVAPNARGKGIGKILLQKAEEWARSNGYKQLTLNVFYGNHQARKLYSESGFGEDVVKYVKKI
jgi:ribosomal protein S18 acetylase RimI-like enzyme